MLNDCNSLSTSAATVDVNASEDIPSKGDETASRALSMPCSAFVHVVAASAVAFLTALSRASA